MTWQTMQVKNPNKFGNTKPQKKNNNKPTCGRLPSLPHHPRRWWRKRETHAANTTKDETIIDVFDDKAFPQ